MKTKKYLPIILITFLVGVVSAGGYFVIQNQTKNETDRKADSTQGIRSNGENSTATNSSRDEGSEVKQIISPKGLFKIDLPQINDKISSPIRVKGWANVFEGEFQVRIKDKSGNVLGTASVTSSEGAPTGGTFDKSIIFNQPSVEQQGTIEFYETSQMDGSISDMATIGIILKTK